jgi:hypothetical protein
MKHLNKHIASVWVVFLGISLFAGSAIAQSARDLVGTWTLVSFTTERDGNKIDVLGPGPKGLLMLDASGRFLAMSRSSGIPKFVSNNRGTGTPDENKAVVQGSIAYFGTYSVSESDKTIVFRIETSTFPNWDGQEQKRTFTVANDELKWTAAAGSAGGGPTTLTWKRVK